MKRVWLGGLLWLGLLLTACAPEALLDPPRAATQTAQAAQATARAAEPTPTAVTPGQIAVSLPTPAVTPLRMTAVVNDPLTVWVDETSEAHIAAARVIGARFTAQTGIPVEFAFVDRDRVAGLARTAALTGRLPDLLLHAMVFSVELLEQGILDPAAATAVADDLGRDTFLPGALELLPTADGLLPALPVDGWQHLILYRRDWFTAARLPPPTSFDALLNGAKAFYNLDAANRTAAAFVSGIVVPTEDNLPATQQTFEHVAVANGCRLNNAAGEVTLLHPACLEALDFYRALVNQYSPPDYQTEVTALKAFLGGRTAMIVTTPRVLPMLAGLDPAYPPRCPECADNPAFLAENTGFLTRLTGYATYGRAANFAEVTYLGITTAADADAAQAFARFWFNDAYLDWLAVEPERKAPLRRGSAPGADDFVERWRALPLTGGDRPIDAVFGPVDDRPLSDLLLDGIAARTRWGFEGGQPRLTGLIYEKLTVAPLLQRMLSGYISSSQAIIDMQRDVSAVAPAPAATPTPVPEGGG